MNLTETSDELDELVSTKDWESLGEEADATSSVTHDGDEHLCFENGFDLAMKLVQMSALAKYAEKDLMVFVIGAPDGSDELAYFLAADEDEVRARIEPLPDQDEEEDEDEEEE